MTRLSFRPRPVDVNKKLAIVRSVKELDGDEGVVSRSVHHGHIALDADNEPVLASASKKGLPNEIPTPQCQIVENYDVLYPATFKQPQAYVRRRPARAETGQFIEYDLDDEDEDWLNTFNGHKHLLPPEKLEAMLYRLELADARARTKVTSGVATADPGPPPFVLGVTVPVSLAPDQAVEVLRSLCTRQAVITAVFEFWRRKREIWKKPILRRLQPSPAVTDTNPYLVFRPREKAQRPSTRRTQRRENDTSSLEKLQLARKNMESAQQLLAVLQNREEKKKEIVECEFQLQRAALQDPEVGKLYLEREAKRVRILQPAAGELPCLPSGAPAGPRLKLHSATPQETPEPRSSLTRDGPGTSNRVLNDIYTPVIATKRRSTSLAGSAGAGHGATVEGAILRDKSMGPPSDPATGGSCPPPPPTSRVQLSSPECARVSLEPATEEKKCNSPIPGVEVLQLHKRKRRRNTYPLRGAAAANAAAAAARLKARLETVVPEDNQLQNTLRTVKEPPRPVEPLLLFAQHVNPKSLQQQFHLHLCDSKDISVEEAGASPTEGPPESGWTEPVTIMLRPDIPNYLGSLAPDSVSFQSMRGRPRIGRGGRLVFDRWDVLRGEPLGVNLRTEGTLKESGFASEQKVASTPAGGVLQETSSALRFAVQRHRSQPRWMHCSTEAPLKEDLFLDSRAAEPPESTKMPSVFEFPTLQQCNHVENTTATSAGDGIQKGVVGLAHHLQSRSTSVVAVHGHETDHEVNHKIIHAPVGQQLVPV